MSKLPYKIQIVQDELNKLSTLKNFEQAQRVILSVIKLLDGSISENDLNLFQLFNDSDGKIRANATWFFEDQVMADRKATYKVHSDNKLNIDFKVYGVNKASKRVVAWATALTPNFEDEPFNSKFSVGIDFIIPKSTDRVIIVLTNNYIIRTLELRGNLTVTFQEILSKWSDIKEYSNKTAIHNILWESFDLQPLNKKFYAGISERFITLRQHLLKENILDEKHSSMFANRLLGRVIFTWFVDKKGIINPDLKYFDSHSFEDDSEYYRTKLERLFFGVLNTPIDEREYKDDITPFLNGGLFEVRQNDLYKNSKLTFPKNYFDDLFKFLSEYNFTTDESTSQFQQVAIDPEMLGRIFENLLAEITEETGEQARKAKGAFYTPREIVDYMCKESLKEYLKTKLPEDTYRDQRLYQLIEAPDKDFQDQDHNWRRDWKPYKDAIISALDDLKVLDPACGSGAFPIGMLQLLVRVYERLEPRFDGYKAKLQIIEKNIYGVDIEPMAVEIARLRTWLSIIVDEESDSKKIKPLPNLEFKFVCANSLIELDNSGATSFWDDSELENKLQVLRDSYFNTESLNKKKKLRNDYDLLVNTGPTMFGDSEKTKQLKTYRPFDNESSANFFNSEFMFGVVDFSIVFGNPPYVSYYSKQSQQNINSKEELQKMIDSYDFISDKKKNGRFNTLMFFIERGNKLLKQDGVLNYIIDTNIHNNPAKDIRKYILENTTILKIVNNMSNFENVASSQVILFTLKSKSQNYEIEWVKFNGEKFETDIKYPVDIIKKDNEISFQKPVQDKISKILNKISSYRSLSELIGTSNIRTCITFTGKKDKFQFFVKEEPIDYPLLEGSSGVQRPYAKIKYSSYVRYDLELRDRLNNDYKILAKEQNKRSPMVIGLGDLEKFKAPKIFVRLSDNRITGTYTDEFVCADLSLYIITLPNLEDKWESISLYSILGILNSSVQTFFFRKMGYIKNYDLKIGTPQIRLNDLRKLPFPRIDSDISKNNLKEIDLCVAKILNNSDETSSENDVYRKNIDELVMDLYELNEEEKEVIKSSIK